MNHFSFLLLALICSAQAKAETSPPTADVNLLKQKLAPHRSAIDQSIAQARALQLKIRGAANEITFEECQALQGRIEANYPLSPFYAVYSNGASFSQFCAWNAEHPELPSQHMKYFWDQVSDANQFGVAAAHVVRILRPSGMGQTSEMEFLLDANFRILERNSRFVAPNGNQTYNWDVIASDTQGSSYEFIHDSNDRGRAFYVSFDGLLSGGWLRTPRRGDRGDEKLINYIYEARRKDWLNSWISPTAGWWGVLYQYTAGEWTSMPQNRDFLFEVTLEVSGQEVCADGWSLAGGTHTSYKPSNNQDPWACSNAW